MPSLRLFGRATFVSGDDLRWMLITSFIYRLVQLGLAVPLIARYIYSNPWTTWKHIRRECFDDYGIESPSWFLYEGHISVLLYICVAIFLAIWGMVWSYLVFHYSSQGTPTYVEPRTPALKKLCHVHLTLVQAMRVTCTVWGISALRAVKWYCECSDDAADGELYDDDVYLRTGLIPTEEGALEKENKFETESQGLSFIATGAVQHYCGESNGYVVCFVGLVTTHIIDFAVAAAILVYTSCKCLPISHVLTQVLFLNKRDTSWSQEKWKICCRCCLANLSCLTCCLFGGAQSVIKGDLSDFAMLMTKYFTYEDYLDVTISDAFAALIMLRRLHLQQEIESKKLLAREAMDLHEQKSRGSKELSSRSLEEERHKLRLELLHRMAESMHNLPKHAISPSGGAREADKATQSWDTVTSVVYEEQEYEPQKHEVEEEEVVFVDAREGDEIDDAKNTKSHQSPESVVTQAYGFVTGLFGLHSDEENVNKDEEKSSNDIPEQHPTQKQEEQPESSRRQAFAQTHGSAVSTREVRGKKLALVPQFRQSIDLSDPKELYLLAQGARFIHHAEAIYFWATYSTRKYYAHLIVEKNIHILRHIQKRADELFLDMARNVLSMGPIPGVQPRDVEYVQFNQSLRLTPYSVVVDHAWKSVVISVRGTDSLDDVLTDITLKPIELTDAGRRYGFEGEGRHCHRGVLSRVEWIYRDLQEHQLLEGLLGIRVGNDISNVEEESEKKMPKYPHYRLLVTGHSLGAACATILTLLLKQNYPHVRCLAYSPPGCTVCAKLGEEVEPYVTSYILDTDIVGRSSVEGFLGVRDEMLEMVARIRVHKHVVMKKPSKGKDGQKIPLKEFNNQVLCTPSEIDSTSEYVQELEKFYALQKTELEKTVNAHGVATKLYPPGRIIQMFRTINLPEQHYASTVMSGETGADIPYTARWARRTDFKRIILSSHFISDHETANVKGQLHVLADQAGLHEPFIALDAPSVRSPKRSSMVRVHDFAIRELNEPVEQA
mmetsp:Transcript_21788/g.60564  ORF Transcript_21788/g.60564 Transcript_21788/m.60564 type:complete len:1005 (-) Transcript_21788:65-3079(-)